MRRRRWTRATGMVGAGLLLTSVAAWAALHIRTPEQQSLAVAPPSWSKITAEVRQGPLVDEVSLPATVVSDVTHAVVRTRGIITGAPQRVGTQVDQRSVLVEIDGRPVIALSGQIPVFRDLQLGTQGPDVAALKVALSIPRTSKLGAAFETFDHQTYEALASLYRRLGYPAPATDTLPAAEVEFVPGLPLAVASMASVGSSAAKALTLRSSTMSVSATLDAQSQGLVRPGAAVSVVFSSGRRAGQVAALTTPDQAGQGEGQVGEAGTGALYPRASVRLEDQSGLVMGDSVDVVVERGRSTTGVVIPASAVWTSSTAETMVTVAGPSGDRDVLVQVTFSSNGLVAVVAADSEELQPGKRVVVSSRQRSP